ncbi:MAG: hypothetical protein EXS55_02230 [Candidatus Magasanikbacteria bacterium]|nr:hypothetical protein [Candidatus Magasanikbacteria bacterium]
MSIEQEKDNLDIATDEQKESIQFLEQLKIGPAQKAELILVVLGLKPAAEVVIFPWNDLPEKVVATIEKTSLLVHEKPKNQASSGKVVATYAVARDAETLQQLLQTDPAKDHEAYGRLMGFPTSAVEAFLNKTTLKTDEDDLERRGIIFGMKLSRDNTKEELRLLEYWSQLIKKYAPATYRSLGGKIEK